MRELWEIASDVDKHWENMNPYARPYVEAMSKLNTTDDWYGQDTAKEIILRFLVNAQSWRGADARRVKAELNLMLKGGAK